MYLAAQRVRAPTNGREGINTFLYSHPGQRWNGMPPDEFRGPHTGKLVAQNISVPPPGNRVQSYLDITAPDVAEWEEIQRSLVAFLGQSKPRHFPYEGVSGRCAFRLSMGS